MAKVQVALVRGWYLNQGELALYERLPPEFEVVAYASTYPLFPQDGIRLPIRRFRWPGAAAYLLGRTTGSYLNRALYKYIRFNQWLWGLEPALRQADIIHAADTYHLFSWQAARARARYGKRLVLTVWENIPFQDERRTLYRFLRTTVTEHTDLFLPVSERARAMLLLQGIPAERVMVLPPAVDLEKFAPRPKDPVHLARLGLPPDHILLLFVGRFHRSKGIRYLLMALGLLEKDPDIRRHPYTVLLVGTGEQEREVDRLIRKLGLSERVRLLGGVPHGAIHRFYDLADVVIAPSVPTEEWQEQFGLVLAEAMASGKAVVATCSGAIPEVVGDAGVLVPPADFWALSDALRRLILDAELRADHGERGRKRAEEAFNPILNSARLAAHYRSLVADPARPPL